MVCHAGQGGTRLESPRSIAIVTNNTDNSSI